VRNKKSGANEDPVVRCRLVARDFKVKGEGRCDIFAAMPPLEAKKMLFRMAAKDPLTWRKGGRMRRKLFFVDVKKAHLNGKVPAEVDAFVRLPDGRVWKLRRWLYGMRPAAQAWEDDFAAKLASIGFVRGKSAPTVFFRKERLAAGALYTATISPSCPTTTWAGRSSRTWRAGISSSFER
jgi:hypothetical protein